MLVQQPDLPFFTISGEYHRSTSTPSTITHPHFPGAIFNLPLSTAAVQHHLAFRRFTNLDQFPHLTTCAAQSTRAAIQYSPNKAHNPPTPSTMPRPSQFKVIPETDNPPPLGPIIAGVKRDASAISDHAQLIPHSHVQLESSDPSPLRLPPRLKEAERMMHVQRWINHLPWPGGGTNVYWGYSNMPGYRHIDDDRELTPPPSAPYLSRAKFTAEEEHIMLRFFSTNSESRHSSALQNPYPHVSANQQQHHPSHQLPFHAQRTAALHQATANQMMLTSNNLGLLYPDLDNSADLAPNTAPTPAVRRPDVDQVGGSRFFAEWEIRLISHLFHEYFPGRPEPMGNAGVVPSVSEVRSRIASSRLKDSRTATAVRAKIKRMQSSGTWIEYQ